MRHVPFWRWWGRPLINERFAQHVLMETSHLVNSDRSLMSGLRSLPSISAEDVLLILMMHDGGRGEAGDLVQVVDKLGKINKMFGNSALFGESDRPETHTPGHFR